jgi:hypothetical protein
MYSDFVLYAGGSVWALDWCPRGVDTHVSAITCEVVFFVYLVIFTYMSFFLYSLSSLDLCSI